MATNLATPYYDDGDEITGYCTGNVTGKTFVAISANRQAGGPAGVSDSVAGGNVSVATAGAGVKVFGVAMYNQTTGNLVGIKRASAVMPVTAAANLSAGTEVQSDATGKAVALSTGIAAGLLLADVTTGNDAQVALYL